MGQADEISRERCLNRRLSAGQMAMVAVGGPIGTGLLLGSAAIEVVANNKRTVFGLVLVTATVLKGWWDSRVNLISGVRLLVGLTFAYFLIRTRRGDG